MLGIPAILDENRRYQDLRRGLHVFPKRFPRPRRVWGSHFRTNLISVQPMPPPAGNIFHIQTHYSLHEDEHEDADEE